MDFLYQLLQKMGFDHPLHPPLTHMPIGLVIGAFIFLLVAITLRRNSSLTKAAYYCIVFAFSFLFPAAFLVTPIGGISMLECGRSQSR